MGVSGTGKSVIGQALAERLGSAFIEGDSFHPAANIEKMSAGTPLDDDDRRPWLELLADKLAANQQSGDGLGAGLLGTQAEPIATSCRRGSDETYFLHLDLPYDVLRERMEKREHFMPASLLQSQFDTLERLEDDETRASCWTSTHRSPRSSTPPWPPSSEADPRFADQDLFVLVCLVACGTMEGCPLRRICAYCCAIRSISRSPKIRRSRASSFTGPDGEHRATASESIGPLSQGIRAMSAHASVRAWATPAILALRIMAKGNLGSPEASELSQLQQAATAIPSGGAKVNAFLKALAVDAPAAASTPQRQAYVSPRAAQPRERERLFSYIFEVSFLYEARGAADRRDRAAHQAARQLVRCRARQRRMGAGQPPPRPRRTPWRPARCSPAPPRPGRPRARLLADISKGTVRVTADELALLGDGRTVSHLMAAHIDVRWPPDLVRTLETKAVVGRQEAPGSERAKAFAADQLFDFKWQVALGDKTLTQTELDQLATSQTGLLKLRDQWVFVDPRRLQRVLERGTRTITSGEALRAAVSGTLVVDGLSTEVDTVGWLEDLRRKLATQDRDIMPAVQPHELDGTLREYQLQGLQWMTQLVDLGLGGILADDMGLGKTVMLIALHLQRARTTSAPTLVVAPGLGAGQLGARDQALRAGRQRAPLSRCRPPARWREGRLRRHHVRDDARRRRRPAIPLARAGVWSSPTRRRTSRTLAPVRRRRCARSPPRRGSR